MVSNVGTRFNVGQTYSRNVDLVDSQHAKRSGRNLPGAPNQNIAAGTRGKFKSSMSYFRDSIKGLFDAPGSKKIAFLKDRIELRSAQKREFAQLQRFDREDRATAGAKFSPPAYNNPQACSVLRHDGQKQSACLRVTLGEWSSKASENAKANNSTVASERNKIADHLMTSLRIEDWKEIDRPALKRLENELRAQGRHDQAEMLEAINSKLSTTITQAKVEERFHGVTRDYIRRFDKGIEEFWRNNYAGGELELKITVAHGFTNPFKDAVYKAFEPAMQSQQYKDLAAGPKLSASPNNITQDQATKIRFLAEKLLEVIENTPVSNEMLNTLGTIRDDIAELRNGGDKDSITAKFFLNAAFLKGINPEMNRAGPAALSAATMLYETFFNREGDNPFGREVASLRNDCGDRINAILQRLGLQPAN